MHNVVLYSMDNCAQCRVALQMLRSMGHEPITKKLGEDITREELLKIAVSRNMPQIEIDGKVIGSVPELRDWLNAQ